MSNKDPAMKQVNSWINRSVGQHQRRLSEGTASAQRLQSLPEQTPDQTELLKQWRANAVATALLNQKREEKPMPVEYAGPEPVEFDETEPLMTWTELFVIVLIVGAVLGLAIKFYTP